MVRPEHSPLEQAPEPLDCVRVALADHEFLLVVIHDLSVVSVGVQSGVDSSFIGINHGTFGNAGLDDGYQRVRLRFLDLHGRHLTLSLQHAEHRSLGLCAPALRALNLLRFVLVGLPSADIGLVNLDIAVKYGCVLSECGADFM